MTRRVAEEICTLSVGDTSHGMKCKLRTKHLGQKKKKSSIDNVDKGRDGHDIVDPISSTKRPLERDAQGDEGGDTNIDPRIIVSSSKRRKKHPFTQDEKQAILEGVKKFGKAWRRIRLEYETVLSSRTDVNIKVSLGAREIGIAYSLC